MNKVQGAGRSFKVTATERGAELRKGIQYLYYSRIAERGVNV